MEMTTFSTPNLTINTVHIAGNNSNYIYVSPISKEFYEVYNCYLYIMMVFGVIGNCVVLVVFMKHPPSTTTDWFIVFITVCDFISSLVNVPVYVTFTNGYWRIYGTTLICRLHMFISQSLVLSSSFLISGLALDRYLKVCRPSITYSKQRARNACIIISAVTIVLSIPCIVMYENRGKRCLVDTDNQVFIYYIMVFLMFVFATIVVVFSYYKVTKVVINSEKKMAGHKGITGRSNTCCLFLLPFIGRNKVTVVPTTENMSRSGVIKDASMAQVILENSSQSINDASHIVQVNTSRPTTPENELPNSKSTSITDPGLNLGVTLRPTASNVSRSTASLKPLTQSEPKQISLRTTRISFLVCSVFIITWIPPWLSFILSTIDGMTTDFKVMQFFIFGRMTYLINTMANPIIYTWLNNNFRKHILAIFCCRKV